MQARAIPAESPALAAALEAAQLPTEDLAEAGRTFFAFEQDGRPVGYAGFEFYGADALLRSVVVLPEMRGRGLGRAMTEEVLARAYELGARRAYLLTATAEAFFEHEGFTRIERDAAPPAILATRQAATICSTAALLARPLTPHG
jgi:N-acetylglutamate synthase-like GNAT family acetyltransferase